MKTLLKLTLIGLIAGTVLAAFLISVYLLTGNKAYYLLFNIDYIPLLNVFESNMYVELSFHYVFCIVSVIGLYFTLLLINQEQSIVYYVVIYTLGSALLYALTTLSPHVPALTDTSSWLFWTIGHALYGCVVGYGVTHWINPLIK